MKDKEELQVININHILPEDNELTDFEKMIMKWTAFDHFCPNIKAEVIWDMMLSEFVVDMVAYTYNRINSKKYPKDAFYLLAKEFPIKAKNGSAIETERYSPEKESYYGAKADYLVAFDPIISKKRKKMSSKQVKSRIMKSKKIILVELKSTPGSFSDLQLERYSKCKPEDMFRFYEGLINKYVGPKLYERNPFEWKSSDKYISQITYMYHQFHKVSGMDVPIPEWTDTDRRSDVKRFHSAFMKELIKRYKKLDLLYLYVDNEISSANHLSKDKKAKATDCLTVRTEVMDLEKKVNRKYEIYTTGRKDDRFAIFLTGKQDGIDKRMARSTFKQVMNTVAGYKEDFEETKGKYEPYNKYKAN